MSCPVRATACRMGRIGLQPVVLSTGRESLANVALLCSFIGTVWNWKFFLIFEALRINWDCLSRLFNILSTQPEHAPAWMNSRSGRRVLTGLAAFSIGAQIVTVICQFLWFPWYNVIITDLTALGAAALFYTLLLSQLGGRAWSISYLLLGAALIAALA
jgi:hypothetical protein